MNSGSSSSSSSSQVSRPHRLVENTLKTFTKYVVEIVKELICYNPGMKEGPAKQKALYMAVGRMRERHLCINENKRVGAIPGVQIGQRFQYRVEMVVIGLHLQPMDGIDYLGRHDNSRAISIVVTKSYANKMNADGTLEYKGAGGNADLKNNVPSADQRLEGVNLALSNTVQAGNGVRVIFKVAGKQTDDDTEDEENENMPYVYDGIYRVTRMRQERGVNRKLVYTFHLRKTTESTSKLCCQCKAGLGRKEGN